MGAAAVALARACGYEGAGTVEFIADRRRARVLLPGDEHAAAGRAPGDRAGVRVGPRRAAAARRGGGAAGAGAGRCWRRSATRSRRGCTPRTRPTASCPRPGRCQGACAEPDGEGVRVDSGIRAGSVVGTSYDPMLAKVIAYGPDRATALDRLDRALAHVRDRGRDDQRRVHPRAARPRRRPRRRAGHRPAGARPGGAGRRAARATCSPPPSWPPPGPRTPAGPWRRALADHGEARVAGGVVTVGEQRWEGAAFAWSGDGFALRHARRRPAPVRDRARRRGRRLRLPRWPSSRGRDRTGRVRSGAGALAGSLEAPMPGTVWAVNVSNGDAVQEGDVLIVLESMKMELSITAPRAGVVEGLDAQRPATGSRSGSRCWRSWRQHGVSGHRRRPPCADRGPRRPPGARPRRRRREGARPPRRARQAAAARPRRAALRPGRAVPGAERAGRRGPLRRRRARRRRRRGHRRRSAAGRSSSLPTTPPSRAGPTTP